MTSFCFIDFILYILTRILKCLFKSIDRLNIIQCVEKKWSLRAFFMEVKLYVTILVIEKSTLHNTPNYFLKCIDCNTLLLQITTTLGLIKSYNILNLVRFWYKCYLYKRKVCNKNSRIQFKTKCLIWAFSLTSSQKCTFYVFGIAIRKCCVCILLYHFRSVADNQKENLWKELNIYFKWHV